MSDWRDHFRKPAEVKIIFQTLRQTVCKYHLSKRSSRKLTLCVIHLDFVWQRLSFFAKTLLPGSKVSGFLNIANKF